MSEQNSSYLILTFLIVTLCGCTFQMENMMEKENTSVYERGEISSDQYGTNQQVIKTINP